MIDFDPISAAAARKAIDRGIYGTPAHARLEQDIRAGRSTESVVTSATAQAAADITRKTDEWLRGIAETMGLTIEELATRYELEDHGASTMHSLEGGFGMRQTWHLKPRKTTDQSPH